LSLEASDPFPHARDNLSIDGDRSVEIEDESVKLQLSSAWDVIYGHLLCPLFVGGSWRNAFLDPLCHVRQSLLLGTDFVCGLFLAQTGQELSDLWTRR
jgi:hypothetical protein